MPAPTSDLAAHMRVRRSPVLLTAFAVAVSMLVLLAGASGAAASSKSLSLGSTGAPVKQLQRKLHVKPVSGYFGQETRSAVIRFQRHRGLKAVVQFFLGPAAKHVVSLFGRNNTLSSSQFIQRARLPEIRCAGIGCLDAHLGAVWK